MDWLDLLAVHRTLKSLLQHHSSKASILLHSAFFLVQLSHSYMTTGKPIALTWLTSVDKVMSLLFNMLSRLVITFLPRGYLLILLGLHENLKVCLQEEEGTWCACSPWHPSSRVSLVQMPNPLLTPPGVPQLLIVHGKTGLMLEFSTLDTTDTMLPIHEWVKDCSKEQMEKP